MRRLTMIACLLVLSSLTVTTVWAQSPHYIKLSPSIDANLCYAVSLKEAGLGNDIQSVTYTLDATATFSAQCFTKNGNPVQGQPKSGTSSATTSTTIPARNGQTNGTVRLCPSAFTLPDPGCTGNQVVRIISVSYTDVTLTDGLGTAGAGDQDLPDLHQP